MFLGSTLSIPTLLVWCRAFKHALGAGVPLVRIFQLQGKKGPAEARKIAGDIGLSLEQGHSLEDALEPYRNRFPKLFLEMLIVGEKTGHLPEVFGELEEYYDLQRKVRRDFLSQITWPVFQFIAAVLVIAALIWILGMIAETKGGQPIAPIGFGLTGASGAATFLLLIGGTIFAGFVTYYLLTRSMRRRAAVEGLLLRTPLIGPCLEALAMGRFCTALHLTMDSGMSLVDAIRYSLRASANAAYQEMEGLLVATIKAGDELTSGIRRCRVFPADFVDIFDVAEISGQIPEAMAKQSEYYREEAARRLKVLARAASFGVWLFVAGLLIWAIFSIAGVYVGAINQAAG